MKNQVNMTTPKETNKAPITNPKGIKIYELSNKEFRIIFLRNFSKLTKNNNNNKNEKTTKQNKIKHHQQQHT